MHEYSKRDLKRRFGLSAPLLRSLAAAGYITAANPGARRDAGTSYTVQDLQVMRMAGALEAVRIPSAKILDALARIAGAPIAPPQPSIQAPRAERAAARRNEAEVHFRRGHDLEDSDVDAARAAYAQALRLHRDHLDARINLGRLLHLAGDLNGAETVYRAARRVSATLYFNLAILLEDLHRESEAASAYRDALAHDPEFGDAHYNLAQLHERAHRPQDALRHLLAYRRHLARYAE